MFFVFAVRLSVGVNASYGGVMVYNDNEWKLICDDNWDHTSAKVVCSQLGFVDGRALGRSAFGQYKGFNFVFTQVNCTGEEDSIFDCPLEESSQCKTGSYASVYCSNVTIIDSGIFRFASHGTLPITFD